jgi:prophage regulatory protein
MADDLKELERTQQAAPDEIIRNGKAIDTATGTKRSFRDEHVALGTFPPPFRPTDRTKGWLASDIAAWQRWRIEVRAAHDAGREPPPPPRWKIALPAKLKREPSPPLQRRRGSLPRFRGRSDDQRQRDE